MPRDNEGRRTLVHGSDDAPSSKVRENPAYAIISKKSGVTREEAFLGELILKQA